MLSRKKSFWTLLSRDDYERISILLPCLVAMCLGSDSRLPVPFLQEKAAGA